MQATGKGRVMVMFNCFMQEGQIPQDQRDELAKRLRATGHEIFSDAPENIAVEFMDVAEGCGYTAGKPSTSSLALAMVPDGTSTEDRTRLLTDICDAWMDVTGCSINEIVASAADASLVAQANV
jgi:phenylpyruvate tautomerase PptA (4-oxalocrotonate tautomerase family)